MQTVDADQLAAIRAAYCNTGESVRDISVRLNIGMTVLYQLIHEQDWPMRSKNRQNHQPKPPQNREQIIARLSRVCEQQIKEVEAASQDAPETSADHERHAKTLNALLRNFKQLDELKASHEQGSDKAGDERMCQSIIDRIRKRVRKE